MRKIKFRVATNGCKFKVEWLDKDNIDKTSHTVKRKFLFWEWNSQKAVKTNNPEWKIVYYEDDPDTGGYYFWDEDICADPEALFDTEEEARECLRKLILSTKEWAAVETVELNQSGKWNQTRTK